MNTLPPHDKNNNIPATKFCPGCKQVLELSLFNKNRAQRDGLAPHCKVCRSALNKIDREKHTERHNTWYKRYYAEHKDEYSARGKKWHEANRTKHNEMSLAHYANNKEEYFKRSKKWIKEHPEYAAAQHSKRRALRKKNGGSFTPEEWCDLKKVYDHMCLRCKRREPDIELTADHILPLNLGGTSYIENIQPLCRSCNSWKSDKFIDYRGGECDE